MIGPVIVATVGLVLLLAVVKTRRTDSEQEFKDYQKRLMIKHLEKHGAGHD